MAVRGDRMRGMGAVATALACVGVACASGPPPAPPPPEWDAALRARVETLEAALAGVAAGPEALEVRLAFPAGVDLDLYVTDPRLETLYYANTPVRSGGELLEDQRCSGPDGDAPRIETARFPAPLPGRYRIGVDYPSSCRGDGDVVPFALSVEGPGVAHRARGLAEPLRFAPIVTEFELP